MKIADGPGRKLTFVGLTSTRNELLRSPVSGLPCVHWRLRIVEQVNASLRLVHEIASTEEFDLTWSENASPAVASGIRTTPQALSVPVASGPARIRVVPETTRIEAHPVLHRPGSPGALAAGKEFGFTGSLSVEEIALRAGEEVVADGVLETLDGGSAGPFRAVERDIELLGATVRLPTRVALGPVLLPWALGTAAALLGGVGAATWTAWHFNLMPHVHHGVVVPPSEVGPDRPSRRHFSQPE